MRATRWSISCVDDVYREEFQGQCVAARVLRGFLSPPGPAGVVTGAGGVWGAQWGCRAFLMRYSRGWREDAGGVCRRELRAGAGE